MTANMRGAMLMVASMLGFTINDAFMKAMSGAVPLFQAIFIRGVLTCILMVILVGWLGKLSFKLSRKDWGLVLLRSIAEAGGAFLFVSALFNMPFANVTAILQALPLTVALAGALFLREQVGWRRMSAILVGFCGVLLIVQPGGTGFNVYSYYAIGAVFVITFRDLATRKLSADVPSLSVALITAIVVTVASGVLSLQEAWAPLTSELSWKFVGAAVFLIGAYLFSVMTMRVGDIGFIAPFRYTGLLAAGVIGFVLFNERPDTLALIGAAIVVGTGLFTLYRERRIKRA